MQFAALLSVTNHTVMRGDRTPPCMPRQSSYLVCIVQIDYRGSVDNQVKIIYFVEVASGASISPQVVFLDAFVRLAIDPTKWLFSFEFVRHKFDLFLHGNITHVKEFIHLVNPIQKGFYVKIFVERGDVNLFCTLKNLGILLPYHD